MKKIVILLLIAIGSSIACEAQEGYKIKGKIEVGLDGPLLLVAYEQGKTDTLGNMRTVNGVFEFTGKVNEPLAAYVMTADQQGIIPLVLENTDFEISVKNTGITVKGGPQQDIYNQFRDINFALLQQQEKIKRELQVAQQEKNNEKMQALQKQFNQMLENAQSDEITLLVKYADSYTAAHVVASGMQRLDLKTLRTRYDILGESAKATVPGRSVEALIRKQELVDVGNIAPNFTLVTPEKEVITLKETKGKVKLIDFWASWCAPCRQENVNVLKIYQKFQPKGLEIISISLDKNRNEWIKAVAEDGMIWKNGTDMEGEVSEVAQMYFVKSIPHTLLLDENNKIIAKNLRGEALQKKIEELLK